MVIRMCEKPGACDSVGGDRKAGSSVVEARGALTLNLLGGSEIL